MSVIDCPYGPTVEFDKVGFYRPNRATVREATSFDNTCPETGEVFPSMTRQSEMEACDIHNVLKQFSQQGFEQLVREKAAQGQYADLPDELDYQQSLNTVLAAQASFATLPSQVRERFHNDPREFLEFIANPNNAEEAIRLGLAQDATPKEPPVQKVEVVNSEPPEPAKGNRGSTGGQPPVGRREAP